MRGKDCNELKKINLVLWIQCISPIIGIIFQNNNSRINVFSEFIVVWLMKEIKLKLYPNLDPF